MSTIQFGWIAPVIGVPESGGQPIVMQEMDEVLPAVAEYFDSVWAADHMYGFERIDDAYLECWTTLTWLAAKLPKLLVGGLVLCNNYRHPAMLAHMAKTLQAFSGGRLVMGIGAGWREDEYKRHGYPFERAAVRIRQLEEAIILMKSMWTQPRTNFNGTYYQAQDLPLVPKPEPIPPILIGGSGEELMLRLIARQADWWNYGGSPEAYARKIEVLNERCAEVGRDPQTIVKTAQVELPQPTDADSSQALVAKIKQYTDLGVTHLMLDFGVVTDPAVVRRIGEEVLSQFR